MVTNQGFDTVEYTASALIDQSLHKLSDVSNLDVLAFEQKELARLGMPNGIIMRHRPAHFQREYI
jgi:peptidyl-dipeptidase Dcp